MEFNISLIIPSYNCEKCLSRAIESVITQPDFSTIQLILVDDGSTDCTPQICDDYSSKYSNIFVLHQNNSGVSDARNAGIDFASGKWIAFLDSDDYLENGIYKKMLSENLADLICCDYRINDNKNGEMSGVISQHYCERSEFGLTLYKFMSKGYTFYSCWNKLYKRDIIIKNDIRFTHGMKLGEDMVFVFSYIKYISDFQYIDDALYHYSVTAGNTTSAIRKAFDAYLEQYLWKKEYFESIQYDLKECIEEISLHFVKCAISSIFSAGYLLNFTDGIKYISYILKNQEFIEQYNVFSTKVSVTKYDMKIGWLITKKKPILLTIIIKYNKLKSKIVKIKGKR